MLISQSVTHMYEERTQTTWIISEKWAAGEQRPLHIKFVSQWRQKQLNTPEHTITCKAIIKKYYLNINYQNDYTVNIKTS